MIKKYVNQDIIEAIEFTGTSDNFTQMFNFIDVAFTCHPTYKYICIFTKKGEQKANVGDYIIKHPNGQFYPCSRDTFQKTYSEFLGCYETKKENK
jgi:hypothetical protein